MKLQGSELRVLRADARDFSRNCGGQGQDPVTAFREGSTGSAMDSEGMPLKSRIEVWSPLALCNVSWPAGLTLAWQATPAVSEAATSRPLNRTTCALIAVSRSLCLALCPSLPASLISRAFSAPDLPHRAARAQIRRGTVGSEAPDMQPENPKLLEPEPHSKQLAPCDTDCEPGRQFFRAPED